LLFVDTLFYHHREDERVLCCLLSSVATGTPPTFSRDVKLSRGLKSGVECAI
jgi:hypothetical protein